MTWRISRWLRSSDLLELVPSETQDGTLTACAAVDAAAQLIEDSHAHVIKLTVSTRRPLSIVERFVLRAIMLQAKARGKAIRFR